MPELSAYSRVDAHAGDHMNAVSLEARRLLANSAIELSTNGESTIRKAAKSLAPGTTVFVPKMPTQSLEKKLFQIRILREVGLNPVPHVVARQLESEQELRNFLSRAVSDGGVEEVLVVGGDGFKPAGPFLDAAALIRSGALAEAGIRTVGVGGYPDGHPEVADDKLRSDLEIKLLLAQQQGIDLRIVTQFSFAPDRIADYCEEVDEWVPGVPVYAGLAGPTSPAQLIKFAKICGVSMSLRGANKLGLNAFKLAANSGPEKQIDVLARRSAERMAGNLAAIHLFSFGGFVESSTWLENKLQASGLS